jgi:hypothetical protein
MILRASAESAGAAQIHPTRNPAELDPHGGSERPQRDDGESSESSGARDATAERMATTVLNQQRSSTRTVDANEGVG